MVFVGHISVARLKVSHKLKVARNFASTPLLMCTHQIMDIIAHCTFWDEIYGRMGALNLQDRFVGHPGMS
ncbi:MAG: hypothetical protein ACKPE1_00930, partial [Dolichospermum sp.]